MHDVKRQEHLAEGLIFGLNSASSYLDLAVWSLRAGHPEAWPQAGLTSVFTSVSSRMAAVAGGGRSPSKHVASALSPPSWLSISPGSWQQAPKAVVCSGEGGQDTALAVRKSTGSATGFIGILELFRLGFCLHTVLTWSQVALAANTRVALQSLLISCNQTSLKRVFNQPLPPILQSVNSVSS